MNGHVAHGIIRECLNSLAPTSSEYHSIPALSFSSMKDLAISPYRYWYLHINPDKPERKETAEMRFGSALHCAVLEPSEFERRYYTSVVMPEFALDTMDDLREFLRNKVGKASGTRKADLIAQVQAIAPDVPIASVIEAEHEARNEGKVFLDAEDWQRVQDCADALRSEPALQPILNDPEGRSEVPLFVTDPNSGVPLKCKIDWRTPSLTLDVKTFSQQRGKSIDKCVHDAIYYEHYHWQAYLYTTIRAMLGDHKPRYLMAFVESDAPHEVRLKELRPTRGEPCLYWVKAEMEVKRLIDTYAQCVRQFGDKPWRAEREIEILLDDDIPQTAFASWA